MARPLLLGTAMATFDRSGSSEDWTYEDRADDADAMRVESVDEDGVVTVCFPGGWFVRFSVSRELAPSYRRLVRAA